VLFYKIIAGVTSENCLLHYFSGDDILRGNAMALAIAYQAALAADIARE
jgi:hypothetical protein